MHFTQHIVVETDDPSALADLLYEWNRDQAAEAPGYVGGRLLAFRDKPRKFVLEAEFESWDHAQKNNDRPETQKWAEALNEIVSGEPKYENLNVVAAFGK